MDTDTALKEHPEIFKEYFGTVVPPTDNKFAALNSAVWSGGSFIYVPKGVKCEIPLQAYFRINSENMGQFERTLIIADEGSFVHYVEGCTAPIYSTNSLHSAVVEIIVKKDARVRYTTIQNWAPNIYNLVTKRAVAEENATMEWVDGNIGSKLTMKYPAVILKGRGAKGSVLSIAVAGKGQHQDAGAKMIHLAPDTTSTIVSKSISKHGGKVTYRGLASFGRNAEGSKANIKCDTLILDNQSTSRYDSVQRDHERQHHARARSDGLEGVRRSAVLPDEPRPVGSGSDADDRHGLHRAVHEGTADGVRGRDEPSDQVRDGRLDRLKDWHGALTPDFGRARLFYVRRVFVMTNPSVVFCGKIW